MNDIDLLDALTFCFGDGSVLTEDGIPDSETDEP